MLSRWVTVVLMAGGVGAQAPASTRAIVIPAERASNVFFARVTINGAGPFWFTVDTGATLTVIDPATARQVGLPTQPAGTRENVGVTGGETELATTTGARLEVGDLPGFAPDVLYVIPVRGNAAQLGHQVDGVLGTDFLRRYVVELDYAGGQVTLRQGTGRDDTTPAQDGVPITVEGNVLLAPATVTLTDGSTITARLLIDTGSSGALALTTPFVQKHQLAERFESRRASVTVGINGMAYSPVIGLASLMFGEAVISRPNASLSQVTNGLSASSDFDGIIGADLLRRYTVTVDYPRRRLIFGGKERSTRPDFSGTWRVDRAASTLSAPAAGGRVDSVAPAFGDVFTMRQSADTLAIGRDLPAVPAEYRLDGSPTEAGTTKLTAGWNADQLTLTSEGSAVGAEGRLIRAQTIHLLRLAAADVLEIETIRSPSGSVPRATTIYRRIN